MPKRLKVYSYLTSNNDVNQNAQKSVSKIVNLNLKTEKLSGNKSTGKRNKTSRKF